jgi:hypothetical protein
MHRHYGGLVMSWWDTDPNVEMNFGSGILRVKIRSSPRLLVLFVGVGVPVGILAIFLPHWHGFSLLVRGAVVLGLIGHFGTFIFRLFGKEVIEFSQSSIVVCKEVRGWERRHEYPIPECHEMQWDEGQGAEGDPQRVKFRAGRKWVRFGAEISEKQANDIFVALQNNLPAAAALVFSSPEEKSSVLKLGLNK